MKRGQEKANTEEHDAKNISYGLHLSEKCRYENNFVLPALIFWEVVKYETTLPPPPSLYLGEI